MNYESTFICSPDLPPETLEDLTKKAAKIIENSNGIIKMLHAPVKKRFAYTVSKYREGSYVFIELSGDGAMISALENFFKVTDGILRYLTIKVEKKKIVAKPAATAAVAPAPVTEVKNESTTEQSTKPTLA